VNLSHWIPLDFLTSRTELLATESVGDTWCRFSTLPDAILDIQLTSVKALKETLMKTVMSNYKFQVWAYLAASFLLLSFVYSRVLYLRMAVMCRVI